MVIPKSNLPPQSEPWARTVANISSGIDATTVASSSNLKTMFKGQAATIQLLSEQINILSTEVSALPLVTSASVNTTVTSVGTGTGIGNFITVYSGTFDFPIGRTSGQIMVFGLNDLDFFSTGSNYYYHRVGINGSYDASSMHGLTGTAGLSCCRVVAGPSFTVTVQVSATAGASIGNAETNITVLAAYS